MIFPYSLEDPLQYWQNGGDAVVLEYPVGTRIYIKKELSLCIQCMSIHIHVYLHHMIQANRKKCIPRTVSMTDAHHTGVF